MHFPLTEISEGAEVWKYMAPLNFDLPSLVICPQPVALKVAAPSLVITTQELGHSPYKLPSGCICAE